jgi:2-oxoglutarate ferredoxin oxidoreductase subunit gamma
MVELKQVRISGFGGQGVVLAGTILGHAATKDGKWVAGASSYGAQARGGSARSDVVISDGPIVYPHVIEADVLVTMAQTAYNKYIEAVADRALIIYDDEMVAPLALEKLVQISIPATSQAIKELSQKQAANIVILGASAAITGMATKQALIAAITENVSARFRDLNVKALELGYRLGSQMPKVSQSG